ncbi:hypothetical protein [Parabacteroides sp. AM08-6]|uniref:hypothetical protein n=1 Tax=Parabacteroides sp. AM08-6 TaxID=2292053 RepID=UPI000F0063A3|nr:hypothetical protein [Parabacteroides sp. AM08-6]RHJ76224.1 hypothetical protein DW103_17095 [Parabacteroides sp. AM08-6]
MDNEGWLIDAHQMYRMIDDLDLNNKDLKIAFRKALSTSSKLIKKEAATRLGQVVYKSGPIKNSSLLSVAININIYRSGRGATIGLFDNRKSTIRYKGETYKNTAYILRWINSGTKIRLLKGRGKYPRDTNRGKMEEKPFFETAVRVKIKDAQDILNDNIEKEIVKIANKKRQ